MCLTFGEGGGPRESETCLTFGQIFFSRRPLTYIGKNNELLQEFSFAHPRTKFQINKIFNSHFPVKYCGTSLAVKLKW